MEAGQKAGAARPSGEPYDHWIFALVSERGEEDVMDALGLGVDADLEIA